MKYNFKYSMPHLETRVNIFEHDGEKIPYWFLDISTILVDEYFWKYLCAPKTRRKLINMLEAENGMFIEVVKEEDVLDYSQGGVLCENV